MVKLVDTRDLKSLGPLTGHAGSTPAPGTNQLLLHRLHNRISRLNERKLKSPAFDEHVAATVSPVLSRGGRTLLRVSRDYVVSAITAKFFRLGVAISPTLRSPGAIDTVAHRAIWQTNIVHRSAASKAGHNHQEKYAHCDVNCRPSFFAMSNSPTV